MEHPQVCYKKNENAWVSRFILDEVVVMPLCRTEDDIQYIYSISNQTGVRIWQLLDGTRCVHDVLEVMKLEFSGQPELIEQETLQTIDDLLEAGIIIQVSRDTAAQVQRNPLECTPLVIKQPFASPDIARVKMQPEQAVLSCCLGTVDLKSGNWLVAGPPPDFNMCATGGCDFKYQCWTVGMQPGDVVGYTIWRNWQGEGLSS